MTAWRRIRDAALRCDDYAKMFCTPPGPTMPAPAEYECPRKRCPNWAQRQLADPHPWCEDHGVKMVRS